MSLQHPMTPSDRVLPCPYQPTLLTARTASLVSTSPTFVLFAGYGHIERVSTIKVVRGKLALGGNGDCHTCTLWALLAAAS